MLELAILGLLKQRPMHGYDLRKRLRDDFGPMANLSFGSLYPALGRLEASGAVRALAPISGSRTREVDEAPIAMTGSLTGERAALMARRATAKAAAALGTRSTRMRKVYEITTEGELLFERLLEEPDARGEEARSFSLRLAFASHLTPQARIRLLERRQVQLIDRFSAARRNLEAPGRALDRYERAIAAHALEAVQHELAFVEALLSDERADLERLPTPTTTTPLISTNTTRPASAGNAPPPVALSVAARLGPTPTPHAGGTSYE